MKKKNNEVINLDEETPKEITLVYCGQIYINSDSHVYLDEATSRELSFSKRLTPCSIGTRLTCTRIGNNFRGPYILLLERSSDSTIALWTQKDIARGQQKRIELAMKKEHPQSIQNLLDKLEQQARFLTTSEKRLFALKVYTTILNS